MVTKDWKRDEVGTVMNDVLLGAVESYENHDAIRNFIDTTFRADKALDEIFGDSERHRLVVVKPNWVSDSHYSKKDVWAPVITHPDIIICIIELIAGNVGGKATICVCDGPDTYADFETIIGRGVFRTRVERLVEKYPNIGFELLDLRRALWASAGRG